LTNYSNVFQVGKTRLTPVHNLHLLLRLSLTGLDLPHSIYKHDKQTTITALHWLGRNESSHDIDSLLAVVNNIAMCMPQADAALHRFFDTAE